MSHRLSIEKLPMSPHLYHYANWSLLFMQKWILLSQPGVNVQLKTSAMCSKVNQALALYTEGPVIFIMLNNTPSWELSSPHIPGQLLVSIIVYLSREKDKPMYPPPPPPPPFNSCSGPATLTGLFKQREVLSYDK